MPLTTDQVRETVGAAKTQRAVVIDDPARVKFGIENDTPMVSLGGRKGTFPLSKDGASALFKHIGFSTALGERLEHEPKLAQNVVTTALRAKPFAAITMDDSIVAFDQANHVHGAVDPDKVITTAADAAGDGAWWDRAVFLDPTKVELHLVTQKIEREIEPFRGLGNTDTHVKSMAGLHVGDVVKAGATIMFSPSGIVAPEVTSYVHRIVCGNGSIHSYGGMRFEFSDGDGAGDRRRILPWIKWSVAGAFAAINPIVEDYKRLLAQPIPEEQRAEILAAAARDARMNADEVKAFTAAALREPPTNMWQVFNLITWVGTHAARNPLRLRTIMARAGHIAQQSEHGRVCPLCNHAHGVVVDGTARVVDDTSLALVPT